ncbi:sugar isomerase [Desulfosporosinus fructosivorans]|uniref:Sugar isomerase n=1 Tax=Desulfosporosinus fructosivorans TaxID=2018669 RepID=A0A4Z0RBX5_9FIRM|nr:polysaccharide biosynthesis C-terminal domain-containing protein [Desulfosporosinus fructosivorans]TGE39739.1 sugar isomerase [Desulfosporosinus fructosivorans]
MRKKKLVLNTVSSLINQIAMVVCAFILPRLILTMFGSTVNGLVSSITQFLTVITLLELGVGAVVQLSLYGPLSRKESQLVSAIMSSAGKFFRRLAQVMAIYVIALLIIYPLCINKQFGFLYTGTLILSLCISYFAQYYFGLKNQLLVIADQRGYIHYSLNTVVLILNNVLGALLIINGFSIQLVKLTTSLTLLLRPICLELYVQKHYKIDKKVQYEGEPIKQKWNGIAQHIATVVLNSTDTIVLTLFSTLANVSIYNVYYLVVNGLRNLAISLSSGMQSLMGNLIAKKENELLNRIFDTYESLFHLMVTFVFGCAMVLIVPFVQIYTYDVSDANYVVPAFGYLICLANMAYCLRMPYNVLVLAAGHYKQTQNSAWMEMTINIVISVLVVVKYGLIGVAVGTLCAMLYRTFYMVWYLSNNIMRRSPLNFIKHMLVDVVCVMLMVFVGNLFMLKSFGYSAWVILALKKGVVNITICTVLNVVFFKKSLMGIRNLFSKKRTEC